MKAESVVAAPPAVADPGVLLDLRKEREVSLDEKARRKACKNAR